MVQQKLKLNLETKDNNYPELTIKSFQDNKFSQYEKLLKYSQVESFNVPIETWSSNASNHALGYSTHNIFRYYGKFPPPIARHLINEYTNKDDLVIDPMSGSGTTALECLLLERNSLCYDVNPLSILVGKVKSTKLSQAKLNKILLELNKALESPTNRKFEVGENSKINDNWFLPETITVLSRIKSEIQSLNETEEYINFFYLAFLSIVRKVSKATTQQGRLFKDVDTAVSDPYPLFVKKCKVMIVDVVNLPENNTAIIENRTALEKIDQKYLGKTKLVICHPPYFNLYKYSTINSLELAWMSEDLKSIRGNEVKEFFKVGKPENINRYIDDMSKVLLNIRSYLSDDGVIGFMNGDTLMQGQYIPVNKMLLDKLKDFFTIKKIALRIPKYTEASWASSQRRKKDKLGVNLCDFVYILAKK